MSDQIEVELDIFSGMPNPTWVLSNVEANSFLKQLSALSRTADMELAGNLGYRGFIVYVRQGVNTRTIRLQRGTVQISEGATTVYAYDKDRALERWLFNTGRPHLADELVQIVQREIR